MKRNRTEIARQRGCRRVGYELREETIATIEAARRRLAEDHGTATIQQALEWLVRAGAKKLKVTP